MNGEYWIHEDGSTTYCDGDIGDQTHESVVIGIVQNDILEKCSSILGRNFGFYDNVNWDEFKSKLWKWSGKKPTEVLKRAGVKKDEWDVAEQRGDARDYAMQKWKWKTYRDTYISTWTMSRQDLSAIIEGIENIADESGISDNKLNRISFSITVLSNSKDFSFTLPQLKQWLQKPSTVPQSNDQTHSYLDRVAGLTQRNQELDTRHPTYTGKDPNRHVSSYVNPFGDSVMSFKAFLSE